jgi:signal transduction histidine kinase/integral membrane sensor domain MASE1
MARQIWYAVIVAILYAIASVPGTALLIPNVFVAPIRLSAGVAIAALVLTPTRNWWLVLLALVPRHAWVGDPATRYAVALQYLAANVAEAVLVAFVLRWLLGARPRLDDLRSCVIFLIAGVILGPIFGATIGAPVIVSRDLTISAFSTWEVWAFADAVGNLVVVPLGLALPEMVTRLRARVVLRPALVRITEAITVWGGILLTTAPGLGQAVLGRRTTALSMLYAPFPLLVWASIRFGPVGAAAANVMLTSVTMLHALSSRAPFGQPWNINSVIETQQFLIVAGATTITLAALVAERWRAQQAEREGEERMRLAMHSARIGTWLWDFESNRFIVSDELAVLLGLEAGAVGALAQDVSALNQIIHPDDIGTVQADLEMFRTGNTRERSGRFRSVRSDGSIEWIKVRRPPEENGAVSGELRVLRRDGMVWIESHGRFLRNANGIPDRAIGVAFDISERKELQAERESTTQTLMRLARSTFGDRGEIDEALREIAVMAADTLAVDRTGIWLFNEQRTELRCVCEYHRPSRMFASGAAMSVDSYPVYFRTIREERTLSAEDTGSDPRTSELVASHRVRGISSMLDAPVFLGGRLAGVVSFQHAGAPRDWSLQAQNFAGSMTDLLSRAFESVERRKAEAEVQRAYRQLRNLARRLEAAKEDERREIARELHDELGQSVTAIVIGLHLVTLDDREGRHAKRLSETVALAERLIERVRAMSLNLRPPLLDELGLITALRGLVDGQAQQSGLEITFAADGVDQRLSPELEIGAFRIVQECLTNVMRHAAANNVTIRLAAEGDQLSIQVSDDGRGFDVAEVFEAGARGRHLGLLGMQERVTVLGGRVDVFAAPGQGTRIVARLPMQVAVS